MKMNTKKQQAMAKFTAGVQQVTDTFQRSEAHLQALELLAMCLFATHPNPEGVREMFETCSRNVSAESERQTAVECAAFHEAFCRHLERIAGAMKAPDATPGVH